MNKTELKQFLNERFQNSNAEIVIPKEALFTYLDSMDSKEKETSALKKIDEIQNLKVDRLIERIRAYTELGYEVSVSVELKEGMFNRYYADYTLEVYKRDFGGAE